MVSSPRKPLNWGIEAGARNFVQPVIQMPQNSGLEEHQLQLKIQMIASN